MRRPRVVLAGVFLAMLTVSAGGFSFLNTTWPTGSIVMHLQLGPSALLSDGCPSWNCSAESALANWNQHLQRVRFTAVPDSATGGGSLDGANGVVFRDMPDREALAFAEIWTGPGNVTIEADVVYNARYPWDSYPGPLRSSGGARVFDFRRVALHEFGHVLGLAHPDDAGQQVAAIMNSRIGDLDSLTPDDIQGGQALYGAALPAFPPRNETFEFRVGLEQKYRDDLRRGAVNSFADVEGSVVWTQEYLRYRQGRCSHQYATEQVTAQILGAGGGPICGPRTLDFPPRDESLAFRRFLDIVYRDRLSRQAGPSFVDLEGEVVWIQQYLVYRQLGWDHPAAVAKVMLDIDAAST